MSPQSARTIVLLAGGLLFVAIGLRRDSISDPFKFAWGAGVITLGLSVAADIVPEVAGPLAILVLMVVYWKNKDVVNAALPTASNTGQAQAAGRR